MFEDLIPSLAEECKQVAMQTTEGIICNMKASFYQKTVPADFTKNRDYIYYMADCLSDLGEAEVLQHPFYQLARDMASDAVANLSDAERFAYHCFLYSDYKEEVTDDDIVKTVMIGWIVHLNNFKKHVDDGCTFLLNPLS